MNYKDNLQLEIHYANSTDEVLTFSIGPIGELTVSYDELAQMISDGLSYDDQHWLFEAFSTRTNLLDIYTFHLAIIQSSHGAVVKEETEVIYQRVRKWFNIAFGKYKKAIQLMKLIYSNCRGC